jgi:phage-related protein
MRFFADAQNDNIRSFFVILRPKDLIVLMCFKKKETKIGDSSPAAE